MKRIFAFTFLFSLSWFVTEAQTSTQQQLNSKVSTATFSAAVQNLNDLIATRLTQSQATGLYKSISYVPTWSEITGKPSAFTPASHTHAPSDILTNAQARFVTDAQINGWNSLSGSGFSGNYADLTGRPALFSGAYGDLTGRPLLFSGSYLDLSNKPTIPTVPSAISAFSNDAGYLNLLTAQSGLDGRYRRQSVLIDYATDLINKPTFFSGVYADLSGKPSLFSGSYNDLTNRPTIPTVPSAVSAFTNDAGYLTAAGAQTTFDARYRLKSAALDYVADLINKPTIPTNTNQLTNGAGFVTASDVTTAIAGKQATLVSGTNIKTVNGNSILGTGDLLISAGGAAATTDASSLTTGTLSDARLNSVGTAGTSGGSGQIVESITRDAKGRVTAVTTIATPTGGGTSTPVYSNSAVTTAELQRVLNAAVADRTINLMPGNYDLGESQVTLNLGGKRGVRIEGRKEVVFTMGSMGRVLVTGSDSSLVVNGITFSCTATTGNTVATGQGLLDVNERGSHSDPEISNCDFTSPNCLRNGIAWNTYSATADGGDGFTSILRRLKIRNCRFYSLGRMGAEILNHSWSDNKVITTIDGIEVTGCEFYDLGRIQEAYTGNPYNGMCLSVSGRAKNIRYINNGCIDAKTYGLEIVGNEGVLIEGSTFNFINNAYIPISLADGYGNGSDATRDITITSCYMRSKTRPINCRGTQGVNISNSSLIGATNEESGGSNAYFQKCTGVRLTGGSIVTGSFNPLRFDDCKEVVINVPSVTGSSTTTNYALISIYSGTGYAGAGSSDFRISLNGSIYKKSSTTALAAGKGTAAGIQTAAGDIYELQGTVPRVTTF